MRAAWARRSWAAACAALILPVGTAAPSKAQSYPSKQIELVVPFVAGGTTDTVARFISQRLSDQWGQPVIVSNRPGGGSSIGTNIVAKAAPDGHTLLVTTIAFAINASLQKQPYDAIKDFTAISELSTIPLMLVVHPSLPINNLKVFIEYSKAQPAGLDYATSGPGTSTHLAAEMFKAMTGAKLVHVPFKGNAEVINALVGGHVKVHFALTASTLQHVRNGTLRVIAVTTEKRLPDLPDVPTIAELGYPAYEISSWQGVFAPAGTPKEIVGRLNREIVAMLKTSEVHARITREGAIPIGSSPEEFSARFKNEVEKWAKVAQSAGLATP
ncbi:MAG: tripartite tricarboxylate transporter substrate binding protein [Xanthobacteraceae bacterium]|nr:tripartite tricarboxylate transporter substrate binding protein [Xanthobacteraceae bacterium]